MRGRILGLLAFLCVATASSCPASAGQSLEKGVEKVGGGGRQVGKSAGHYGQKAGQAAKGAAKDTGKAVGKAFKDIGKGLKKAFR